jgi:ribosomal protein L12E/L44/L45/RPP1/RPP2
MKTGARVGLALAAGYVLGRLHKMKWALALAAMAGRRRLPGGTAGLLEQGAKFLASSPELAKVTEEIRGQLVEAGKAAAVAAVSSKINSLSDDLRERSEAMRAASAGGNGAAPAGGEERAEDERYRDESERDRDEDLAPRHHGEEDAGGRGQAERVPAPRGESDRAPVSRESRRRERPAAGDRGGHPSRQDVEDDGPRREPSRPRGDRSRPRSTTSRSGGDSE